MIRSMTGFASKTIILDGGPDKGKATLSFALKSLNSRFFDTNCKMPYPISNWDTELVKLFKSHLHRGYVSFIIQLSNPNIFRGPIEPAMQAAQGYLQALDAVKNRFNLSGDVTIHDILLLPNIFNSPDQEIDQETKNIIFNVTNELLIELIASQEKEGAALARDINMRIDIMKQEMIAIEKAYLILVEAQKKKVHQALEEIGLDENKYSDLKKSALYNYLDKIDINEEIVRFNNHIASLQETIKSSAVEKGKRLDFIMQELGREINTITAKCSDSAISSHAITIKVELEKTREQAQNIV